MSQAREQSTSDRHLTTVQKAHKAYAGGDFANAIILYKEAATKFGSRAFDLNIAKCKERIELQNTSAIVPRKVRERVSPKLQVKLHAQFTCDESKLKKKNQNAIALVKAIDEFGNQLLISDLQRSQDYENNSYLYVLPNRHLEKQICLPTGTIEVEVEFKEFNIPSESNPKLTQLTIAQESFSSSPSAITSPNAISNLRANRWKYDKNLLYPESGTKAISYAAEALLRSDLDISVLQGYQSSNIVDSNAIIRVIERATRLSLYAQNKPTILIAGHDLRFVQPIIKYFEAYFSVCIDEWTSTTKHDETKSLKLLQSADIVWCEWCCQNAVWYSRLIKPHQRLFVRIHKFEIETEFPSHVEWKNVNGAIFIAPGMQRYANTRHSINCKQYLVFNAFDVDSVYASFNGHRDYYSLALLGYVPKIKRLDKAVDIAKRLFDSDSRFSLHMKGKSPESFSWILNREISYFETQYQEVDILRTRGMQVSVEGYDDSVHQWIASKGFLLSVSDIEGSHQAVAESMACGTIPIICGEWAQEYDARHLYPSELCFNNLESAVSRIRLLSQSQEEYNQLSKRCIDFAHENFNIPSVMHTAASIVFDGGSHFFSYTPINERRRICLFTDLAPNVIDGSSVWLSSVVEILLEDPNLEIIVLTREKPKESSSLSSSNISGKFRILSFSEEYKDSMHEEYIRWAHDQLVDIHAYKIIVRVSRASLDLISQHFSIGIVSRIVYYTYGGLKPSSLWDKVTGFIFQTNATMESFTKNTYALKPSQRWAVVPPTYSGSFTFSNRTIKSSLTILYTGKLCRDYLASEMLDYAQNLDISTRFIICMAKIQNSDDPEYVRGLKSKLASLQSNPFVPVFKGLNRDQIAAIGRLAHVGWSIRSDKFKNSNEISTKTIEFCALGIPVLLNRVRSNILLLGEDYPLYCDSIEEVSSKLAWLRSSAKNFNNISDHCLRSVAGYSCYRAYKAFSSILE